jgi:ABC-2 type transport system permease protein
MSTETSTARDTARAMPPASIGVPNILRSEWTKLRSVRSTYWTLAAAVLATISIAVIACITYVHQYPSSPPGDRGDDLTLLSLNGLYLAQLAIGTLGVLAVSGEYATGMIRTTLAAVPQRRTLLAAKAVVFTAIALLVGEITSFAAFLIGQAILATAGSSDSLASASSLRAVIGGGLFLAAVGLLGLGLGAAIRHTAGATAALFGLLFLPSALVDLLPTTLRNDLIPYMPANAGSQIFTVIPNQGALAPWAGFAVFCGYAVVALGAALFMITRRDA